MNGLIALIIISVLVGVPVLAYPEVSIMMTNGREIIADTCEQEGDRLVCTKMGGTFDIEKKDVVSVKGIKTIHRESVPAEKAASPTEPEKTMDKAPTDKSPDEVMQIPSPGGQSAAVKRLEDISQRKRELFSEREKLVKEKEQLNEDINKTPDWMPVKQYEELQERNAELDKKIKKFNEEVGELNREEKNILDESKKKQD